MDHNGEVQNVTGARLWQAWISSGTFSRKDMEGLGYALFKGVPFGRVPDGSRGVMLAVGRNAGVDGEALYTAANKVQLGGMFAARRTLVAFGQSVANKISYERLVPAARGFVDAVASNIPATAPGPSRPVAPAGAADVARRAADLKSGRLTESQAKDLVVLAARSGYPETARAIQEEIKRRWPSAPLRQGGAPGEFMIPAVMLLLGFGGAYAYGQRARRQA